jgi:L-lactate dehydrogenase complex protein LldE
MTTADDGDDANGVADVRVSLLITCVVDIVAPEVGAAAVRLLRAADCTVTCDLAQTCCGQPAWSAGYAEEAAAVARTTLDALEAELERGADVVVVPSGSCATMVRASWPEMFEIVGDPATAERARQVGERTRELSELLADRADALPRLSLRAPTRVALHQSCHLLGELRITTDSADLLDDVDGCEVVAWDAGDRCCGFGGTLAVPPNLSATTMADDTLRGLARLAPDVVVGCDTTCLLHLRSRATAVGAPVEIRHLSQVLADALPQGTGA